MAAAARACDAAAWDAAWARCEAYIERLDAARGRSAPGTPTHRRRVALLRQILADDAEIERIRHPAYARLEAMLRGELPERD
jgi:hypothetical protein